MDVAGAARGINVSKLGTTESRAKCSTNKPIGGAVVKSIKDYMYSNSRTMPPETVYQVDGHCLGLLLPLDMRGSDSGREARPSMRCQFSPVMRRA